MNQPREELPFDVLFVGGGPANLASAIRLAQLSREKGLDLEIGLIEKGDFLGAHSLSGAVMDPRALARLLPDYLKMGCPVETSHCQDALFYLTPDRALPVPYIPPFMDNHGCFVTSMSKMTAWLGEQAEALGVNIFCGFAGKELLFAQDGRTVAGVRTGDKGVDKSGQPRNNFELGADLLANVTVLGEGPCGSLARDLNQKMKIYPKYMPQEYETAIKEVIELPSAPAFPKNATVLHTFGHPLGNAKGGAFLYQMGDNRVTIGLVMGLNYKNPMFNPHEAFLSLKKHPLIQRILAGGKVVQQGAKIMCVGGFHSMPTLAVDGALLVGESASMLNPQRLKGIHTSMESGMLAAETIIQAFENEDFSAEGLSSYEKRIKGGWVGKELREARNFSQALSKKGVGRYFHMAAQHLSEGKGLLDPMPLEKDSQTLSTLQELRSAKAQSPSIETDGVLMVDKLTGVYLSGTKHEENQPCHLLIHDMSLCLGQCYEEYANPCTRFCPGQVYEMEMTETGARRLKLNPSNCLHCKTCEIKDPFENITWTCPEGGGGPRYQFM